MFFPSLKITNAGKALLIKALSGETLTFTKLGLGNGTPQSNLETQKNLVSAIITYPISQIEIGDGCASISGTFDNSQLDTGFFASEFGIFANDPDFGEILYAYAFESEYPTYIAPSTSASYEKVKTNVVIAIGDATNVTAIIGEAIGYVTKSEFMQHKEDTNNPHQITADHVGLGNVPNVSTNNQKPTYTESNELKPLVSGETVKEAFAKIKKAINVLISHLSEKNPHKISPDQIGASKSNHVHNDLIPQELTLSGIVESLTPNLTPNYYAKFTGKVFGVKAQKISYISGKITINTSLHTDNLYYLFEVNNTSEFTANTIARTMLNSNVYNLYIEGNQIFIQTDGEVPEGTEIYVSGFWNIL